MSGTPERIGWRNSRRFVALIVVAVVAVGAIGLWFLWGIGGGPDTSELRPVVFERDLAQLEDLVIWVEANADCSDYYVELPDDLAYLTASGLISCGRDSVFVPQWYGIPDDAGGFWYSPHESPEGYDMWGMICRNPVDLGDGWWECGMAE
jgi:hypothetical protein